jgi:CRP-like cAMP-binding protein
MANPAEHYQLQLPQDMASDFRNPEWGGRQLASIPVFKQFVPQELTQIYGLGEIVSLKPKSYAVIEGEPTRGLYIILHGMLSVYKNDQSSGSLQRIAYLEAGNNFGELSLFDDAPRSASVAAESVCHLFYLDANIFNQYLDRSSAELRMRFYKGCSEELVKRFRRLNSDYIAAQQLLWRQAMSK